MYDLDFCRKNGNPVCKEVTKELLIEKINDGMHPFGHGYVVASYILGIYYEEYI